jgi:hypothetical protein
MVHQVSVNDVIRDATPEEAAQIDKDRAEFAAMMAAKPAKDAREKRDLLLKESDWTQLSDVVISNKDAWATYRQSLRDITKQAGFPDSINWPVAPTP